MLNKALDAVTQDRNKDYGAPEDNFRDVARLWGAYRGDVKFSRTDVAVMMILVKVARTVTSPIKDDHWVDIAGYAACGYPSSLADDYDAKDPVNGEQ